MAIPCPACNKADQTAATCGRCGCDLSKLHTIVAAAARRMTAAHAALVQDDWTAALAAAEQSWRLVHSYEAARLGFLAAGALGDTSLALHWHRRARADAA